MNSLLRLVGGLTVLLCTASTSRSTNCEQAYRLLFKARHEPTFWIGEDLYGECGQSNLVQISLEPAAAATRLPLAKFAEWGWAEGLKANFATEPAEELPSQGAEARHHHMALALQAPPENAKLDLLFKQEFGEYCAPQFNKILGRAAIDLPRFEGARADLLYHSPGGLYFNYRLGKAYLFPDSRLLLVFTKNPLRCQGGDTAHGFLIFRLQYI
ncbi:MAG: hypothetical protein MUC97_18110 [Bernardetiaceae bacterium]|jgi:hypothetical protein|nr:hypothetical protein [Bernardetiaceae bacterium]